MEETRETSLDSVALFLSGGIRHVILGSIGAVRDLPFSRKGSYYFDYFHSNITNFSVRSLSYLYIPSLLHVQALVFLTGIGSLTLLPVWRSSGIVGSSGYGGALGVGAFMGLCFLAKAALAYEPLRHCSGRISDRVAGKPVRDRSCEGSQGNAVVTSTTRYAASELLTIHQNSVRDAPSIHSLMLTRDL